MTSPNGRPIPRDQLQLLACDCGAAYFDVILRVFLLRDKLDPRGPLIEQPAKGYKCGKCGKEPDLSPKMLENL